MRCGSPVAEVVLMEIPRAYMSDPYWGVEREIAREEDVELVSDTAMRTLFLHSPVLLPGSWWGEPYFTDEGGIHANARGQQILAEAVAEALVPIVRPSDWHGWGAHAIDRTPVGWGR